MKSLRQIIKETISEALDSSKMYIGSEAGVTRFMRNIDSEISPYINRISNTEVSINPEAFKIEPALEGEGGMLDFFGLKPKYEFSLNQ